MIKVNGEPAAKFDLANGTDIEVIYPDGEESARKALDYMPGTLWKRQAYATADKNPVHVEDPVEVPLEVSSAAQLN
jgi:hypothetical protein